MVNPVPEWMDSAQEVIDILSLSISFLRLRFNHGHPHPVSTTTVSEQ